MPILISKRNYDKILLKKRKENCRERFARNSCKEYKRASSVGVHDSADAGAEGGDGGEDTTSAVLRSIVEMDKINTELLGNLLKLYATTNIVNGLENFRVSGDITADTE